MAPVSPANPKALRDALQELEQEIESRSEALPPDDKSLDAWKARLDQLWAQIQPLRRDARNRLWVVVQRVGDQIELLRDAGASFFAKSVNLDETDPTHAGTGRAPLSSAIGNALSAWSLPISQIAPSAPPTEPARPQLPRNEPAAPSLRALPASPEAESTRDSEVSTAPQGDDKSSYAPTSVRYKHAATDARQSQGEAGTPEQTHPNRRPSRSLHLVQAPAARSQRTDPIVAYLGRLARADTFDEASAIACLWLRTRRFELPEDISVDFECGGPGNDRAVVVRHEGIWAMQADTFERATNRRWRLEMVLLKDGSAAPVLSLTLYATGPVDQPTPQPTVPRLAAELIDKIGLIDLSDGTSLSTTPELVETEVDVDRLVAKLRAPRRQHPIIVISRYSKDGISKTLLDPVGLAERLRGLAHVAVLGQAHHASWALTDRLSKRFSVFGASLRLYRPRFTTEDDPADHPLWTPTVLQQRNIRLDDLQEALMREAAASSLLVLGDGADVPAFDDVQKAVLKRRIEQAQARQHNLADTQSYQERIVDLERALEEANTLATIFSRENDALKFKLGHAVEERDAAAAKVSFLDDRVRLLQQLNTTAASGPAQLPDSWDGIEDWAEENLGKRVKITPKAVHAARRSPFEDIPFAYAVLLFLANTYVPCRRGEMKDGKTVLEREQARLGIEISSVGKAVETRRWRSTYSTPYKSGQVPLDMHVSGKNDRDPRYGFRLYFHWDDADKCVVVGSFPSHLDNSLS